MTALAVAVLGVDVNLPFVVLGVIVGLVYGLLGVGLVLVFRANRIINFAHGEIGALGAAILGIGVVRWGLPYWLFLPVAVAASALVGAFTETVVIRRFRDAPRLMSVVATLGMAVFLLGFTGAIAGVASKAGANFPVPPGMPSFFVGPLFVTPAHVSILILTPLTVLGLYLFLRFHRVGLGIRAAAANPDRARMLGIPPGRMSTAAWAIAGAISAMTAILVFPTRGFIVQAALGPALLLRALVPAVLARMERLPVVFGAGVLVGVVEQVLLSNSTLPRGTTELVLFVVILATLLIQRPEPDVDPDKARWAAVQAWPPLTERLRGVWEIRNLGWILGGAALVFALIVPQFMTHSATIVLTAIAAIAVVGLSVGIVTGLGGQLSLGQYALAGVGAIASFTVSWQTGNVFLGWLAAGVTAAVASLVIGLPALRIRGLFLTVTTLAFAIAAQSWLFGQGWAFSPHPGRPVIGISFESDRSYFYLALAWVVIATLVARNLWRSGISRRLRSIRDNEDGARAFGIPVTTVKLQMFVVAGFLAGIGGAVFAGSLSTGIGTAFGVDGNINLVAMTALGGLSIMAGPLIGALYIVGVPRFLPLDAAGLAASAAGWLILLLYFPGGLAQVIRPVRDRVIGLLARRRGIELDDDAVVEPAAADFAGAGARAVATGVRTSARPAAARPVLEAADLQKRYGGLAAVDGVSLQVHAGEVLGIIGPNGAGKSTLFDLLSGFERADGGRVTLLGGDATRLSPERRTERGLVRSFQDAALFPTLTVRETLQLALEGSLPTRLLPALAGATRSDRLQRERARELIGSFGLLPYRDRQIRALSTGTRRITELACAVALQPKVLLLDEPSSGIAQRETEALGGLLQRIRDLLDATLVVIEHDIPLITSIADRIVAMESGRVIADGTPAEIQRSPAVVAAYLGSDAGDAALLRSGAMPADDPADDRCHGTTKAGTRCSRRAVEDRYCRQHHRQLTSTASGR